MGRKNRGKLNFDFLLFLSYFFPSFLSWVAITHASTHADLPRASLDLNYELRRQTSLKVHLCCAISTSFSRRDSHYDTISPPSLPQALTPRVQIQIQSCLNQQTGKHGRLERQREYDQRRDAPSNTLP